MRQCDPDTRPDFTLRIITDNGPVPGCTPVCPDSHTCTQGAFGALAWGIGSSEAEHALVTKTLRVKRPGTMRVRFEGELSPGVTARDVILHLIGTHGTHGTHGGSGCAVEFAGPAVEALGMAGRMTLSNMAVEFSAFTGMIAPDQKTFDFLAGRPYAPTGHNWLEAESHWTTLVTDHDAEFDHELVLDVGRLEPQVTWGTSPQHAMAISGKVPDPCADTELEQASREKALAYMDLQPGDAPIGKPIDAAFIGSCTNARLEDLRQAAALLRGR